MILLFFTGGVAAAGIDFAELLADLYPALNAGAAGELVWWTEAELYEHADEAAKELARGYGVFVERDDSTGVLAGTAVYELPARHLSTIHAALSGRALCPLTVQELEALDALWPETDATADEPVSGFLGDSDGTERIRLYGIPDATGTLSLVFHRFPAAVNSGNYLLAAPPCLAPYFAWRVLAAARRKDSKARMPEVAEHFAARAELVEQVIEQYWGTAQ